MCENWEHGIFSTFSFHKNSVKHRVGAMMRCSCLWRLSKPVFFYAPKAASTITPRKKEHLRQLYLSNRAAFKSQEVLRNVGRERSTALEDQRKYVDGRAEAIWRHSDASSRPHRSVASSARARGLLQSAELLRRERKRFKNFNKGPVRYNHLCG